MDERPRRVTKIWLLPATKCANGLANALVFTGGLTARTCSRVCQRSAPSMPLRRVSKSDILVSLVLFHPLTVLQHKFEFYSLAFAA